MSAAQQLALFEPPTAPAPTTPPITWVTGPFDRSGTEVYVHLIRAPDDPERSPRKAKGDPARDTLALWRKRLLKDDPAVWAERVAAHLADGVPRTLNRIAVELIDKTADGVFQTPFDDALWLLVDARRVACTTEAPILFTVNNERKDTA